MTVVDVVEYTDVQCVWSWSSEPKLRWLRARYGDQLRWRRVFGILVHDIGGPHPDDDPNASAEAFRAGWLDVAGHTGAPIPRSIEWTSTSSRRASQAAKAAELQGPVIAERVVRRLREAVFVAGRAVDTPSRIADAVAGVPDLDVPRLLADAASPEIRAAIRADFEDARDPDPEVIGLEHASPNPGAARTAGERLRYGFPTLVLTGEAGRRIVPGWRSAETYDDAVRAVAPSVVPRPGPALGATEALERYRSLTLAELELLTGSQLPPLDAVPIVTSTTPLFVHADDVAAGHFARRARVPSEHASAV
jgi:predicted DsbA family dithiol-disulfide isomerase